MAFERIRYAGLAWPVLTRWAAERRTATYGELAELLGIHRRVCRLFLEVIQDFCLENGLKPLTALVIDKGTRLPGHGFIAWDITDAKTAQELVYAFDWTKVNNPFGFAASGESMESLGRMLVPPRHDWQTVYRLVETRGLRQVVFRQSLLHTYNRSCAVSDCCSPDLLQAAHILPWENATPEERLDVRNGLLLASTYHHLFDLDWIRITEGFKIVAGPNLPPSSHLGRFESWITSTYVGQKLRLPSDPRFHPNPEYIRRRYED